MQILLIGNGFDIEHDLPTQYKQFLYFVCEFKQIQQQENKRAYIEQRIEDERLADFFRNLFLEKENETLDKLDGYFSNNCWLDYFLRKHNGMKDGWIDFEIEISQVIQLLECAKEEYENESVFPTEAIKSSRSYNYFMKEMFGISSFGFKKMRVNDFVVYKKMLLESLNNLILALELYLSEYVEKIEINKYNPDIANLTPTHVLSFNYTDTYRRVYDIGCKNIEYAYIHGKVDVQSDEENNMILGIDDYLDGKDWSQNIEFIEFQKFYQRMQKKTLDTYKIWKNKIDEFYMENGKPIKLYIFGHSLDITDKDILTDFLMDMAIETTIFYHDKKAHDRCIANLVSLIGKENLDMKMYGIDKTIELCPQRTSRDICEGEFRIKNDIRVLNKLNEANHTVINNLLKKIDNMLTNNDLEYFQTQQLVISVYSALVRWELNEEYRERLFYIAQQLVNKDELIIFSPEGWADYDSYGEFVCHYKTQMFIERVNDYNVSKCQPSKLEIIKDEDLIAKYRHAYQVDKSILEDIFNRLEQKLEEGDEYIIDGIYNIMIHNYEDAREIVRRRIDTQENRVLKVRYKDLINSCEEYFHFVEEYYED